MLAAGSAALGVFAPQAASAATPTVSLSASSGVPGAGLTVSGSGWTASDTIFVQIGSSTFDTDVVCALTANLSGVISGNQATNSCIVPKVPAGSRVLVAIDEQSMSTVAHGSNFTVNPGLVLTPAGGAAGGPASPGARVSVQGAGFAAGSSVSGFTYDGTAITTTPSSVATDANGTFTASVSYTVPATTTAGTHTLAATDGAAHTGNGTQNVVVPTTVLSPTSGGPGTGVTVSGNGWPGGDTVFVQIGSSTFDTDVVCALTASVAGEISGNQATNSCAVPRVLGGSQPLVALDEQQQGVQTASTFTVVPGLVLTPAGAPAGTPSAPGVTITVQGHGFAAGSTVSGFKFDSTALTTTPSSATTDASGNFTSSVTFTVPASASAGTHTVSATDGASHTGSASLVLFKPTLTVSPTSGAPGTGLTVSGNGWPALDSIFVQIGSTSFDTDVACALQANLSGSISGNQTTNSCTVPNVIGAKQPLIAIDEQQPGVAVTKTFTVKPGLVLTPAHGVAGGPSSPKVTLTVTGHGFAATSTVSSFKFDATAVTTTPPSVSTDANGNFSTTVTFTIPVGATAGSHTVSATDSGGHKGTATQVIFRPTVSVTPAPGGPGTGLTVSGSGWPALDTAFIQIGSTTFDSDVVCALQANLSGDISGNQASNSCAVPKVPAGSQPLVAIDDQQQGVVAFGTNYTVQPELILTPGSGTAGSPASPGVTVTVQGEGFAAASSVGSFKFDGAAVTTIPSSVATDANGTFTSSVTFTVPAAATAGAHTVSATDSASNKANDSLVVFTPTVVVSPTSGAAGTSLTVSGGGWPASDAIFVQIGSSTFDTDVVCAVTANLAGDISGNRTTNSCAVPSVPTGTQKLVAIDDQQQGVVANGAAFTVTATRGVRAGSRQLLAHARAAGVS